MVGVEMERQGIIRHGAKMIAAMASAEVPKYTVVLRKAYAAGYYAMCAPGFEPRATLALPTATIGPMSARRRRSTPCTPTRSPPSPTRRSAPRSSPPAPPSSRPTSTCCAWASDLVVDAVVEPGRLRAELAARMVDADRWTRTTGRRHHRSAPLVEEDDDVRRNPTASRSCSTRRSPAASGVDRSRSGSRSSRAARALDGPDAYWEWVARQQRWLTPWTTVRTGEIDGLPLLRGREDQRRRQLRGPLGRGPGDGGPRLRWCGRANPATSAR